MALGSPSQKKQCPNCNRTLPTSAKACSCGYDFVRRRMNDTTSAKRKAWKGKSQVRKGTVVAGCVIFALGVLITMLAFSAAADYYYVSFRQFKLGPILTIIGIITIFRGLHGETD